MKKPNNYENTQAQGEFTPVELGGHTLVIKQVTLPFASAEVNTLPRGVVIRNSFFCAIYSPSILQCGNPPNRLSDQDNTLQCLNRTSFRSAGLSIS